MIRNPRNAIGDCDFSLGDGKEELIFHANVNGHQDEICHQVVDESQSISNTDVVKWNAKGGYQVEQRQLGTEDVDDGE